MEKAREVEYERPTFVLYPHNNHVVELPAHNLTVILNRAEGAKQGLYYVCPNCLEGVQELIHRETAANLIHDGANSLDSGLSMEDINFMQATHRTPGELSDEFERFRDMGMDEFNWIVSKLEDSK